MDRTHAQRIPRGQATARRDHRERAEAQGREYALRAGCIQRIWPEILWPLETSRISPRRIGWNASESGEVPVKGMGSADSEMAAGCEMQARAVRGLPAPSTAPAAIDWRGWLRGT